MVITEIRHHYHLLKFIRTRDRILIRDTSPRLHDRLNPNRRRRPYQIIKWEKLTLINIVL